MAQYYLADTSSIDNGLFLLLLHDRWRILFGGFDRPENFLSFRVKFVE
jgi:hypothetical protein